MEGRNATVPLRQHLRDTELIPGRVVSIDHANRTAVVEPTDNGEPFELKYDEIVLGAGAVTRAFPIPGLAEVAIGLKTMKRQSPFVTGFWTASRLHPCCPTLRHAAAP